MRDTAKYLVMAFLVGAALPSCIPASRSEYTGWDTLPGEGDCIEVVVDNRRFADAVVTYTGGDRRRVGLATGKMISRFELCGQAHRDNVFWIHGVGGAFDYTLRGDQAVPGDGSPIRIMVGLNRAQSWIQGEGFGVGDGEVEITELEWVPIMGIHVGIWYDVAECLGFSIADAPDPRMLQWGIATAILEVEREVFLYGAYIAPEHGGPAIVIERGYWFHASVISHEVAHVMGASEDSEEITRCTMPVPGVLPLRRVERDGGP